MKRDVLAVGNGKAVVATGAPAEVPPAPERSPAPTVKTPADAAASAADASSSPPPAAASLTATQRTIASRMTHSRASVPDFDAEIEIDMAACLALRAQLREHADPAPSINDMIVKACALTLRDHPRVNGAFADAGFTVHDDVHVGVAVATEDALVVPVVRDADARSLGAIAATTRALAAKVRDRAITPAELEGATFTVSNLGMFGVTRFTAVIDEPQAAILAVGAVVDRPVGRDGQIVLAPMLTVTLAADHRIVYGADAARFLAALRELLENPMRMLL
jgi:pyruvate dehydrogenase E2 component (dihydrolipoamide acetyltransferase)